MIVPMSSSTKRAALRAIKSWSLAEALEHLDPALFARVPPAAFEPASYLGETERMVARATNVWLRAKHDAVHRRTVVEDGPFTLQSNVDR